MISRRLCELYEGVERNRDGGRLQRVGDGDKVKKGEEGRGEEGKSGGGGEKERRDMKGG